MASSGKPAVIVVAVDQDDMITQISTHLWTSLSKVCDYTIVGSRPEALVALDTNPHAVILGDAAVLDAKQRTVLEYLRADGRVILACVFSSMSSPPKFDAFMKTDLSLDWRFGNYCRSVFHLHKDGAAIPALEVGPSACATCGKEEGCKRCGRCNRVWYCEHEYVSLLSKLSGCSLASRSGWPNRTRRNR